MLIQVRIWLYIQTDTHKRNMSILIHDYMSQEQDHHANTGSNTAALVHKYRYRIKNIMQTHVGP
jgi:hypothetical protein